MIKTTAKLLLLSAAFFLVACSSYYYDDYNANYNHGGAFRNAPVYTFNTNQPVRALTVHDYYMINHHASDYFESQLWMGASDIAVHGMTGLLNSFIH